ncbi:MAG: lamin tail domain-containing protein [Planctomycetota bacterium]
MRRVRESFRAKRRRRLLGETLEVRRCLTATIRLVAWNTANGPNNAAEDADFRTVLEAIGDESVQGNALAPTIVALQETDTAEMGGNSIARIESVLESLHPQSNYTAAVSPLDSGDDANGFLFDDTVLDLVSSRVVPATPGMVPFAHNNLRAQFRPDGTNGESDFYVYSVHLKAGSSASDESRRDDEAAAIRIDIDSLGPNQNVLLVGDLNIPGSSEAAYQNLLATGTGQLRDPIDRPGEWNNNFQFRDVHTQNPAINGPGGMDDRFDFQLVSNRVLANDGLRYIAGSYRAFGNNGTHTFNSDITTGTGATPTVLAALAAASDHLPVVADYTFDEIVPSTSTVVISEIMYNPSSSEPDGEWIEIVNLGTDSINVSGWQLDDEDGSDWALLPPCTTPLQPGDVAVIHSNAIDTGVFRDRWSIPDSVKVVGVAWGSLANGPSTTNEILTLSDAQGTLVDVVNYDDDGTTWPADNNASSIYLADLLADNQDGANWRSSTAGVEGAINPTSAPFSTNDVGSPGTYPALSLVAPTVVDVQFDENEAGELQRSVLRSLTIAFDQPVLAGPDAFAVRNRDIAGSAGEVDVSVTLETIDNRTEATLEFGGPNTDAVGSLLDGNYVFTIDALDVRAAFGGVRLDGNQDGSPGDDFVLGANDADRFFRFFGDRDGDRDVDGQDYGRFASGFLSSTGQADYDPFLDSDMDGDIDGQDYGRFSGNFLQSV